MLDWGYITASWDIAFAENKMSNSFFFFVVDSTIGSPISLKKSAQIWRGSWNKFLGLKYKNNTEF